MPYHHNTIPPHHRTPTPTSRPDAAPAATGARVAVGPPQTLATALTRRVDVRTPPRRRPDTVTPLAVPVCRTRLQYPFAVLVYSTCLLAGTLRTRGMNQAQAICHTLRTAHRIPRRPDYEPAWSGLAFRPVCCRAPRPDYLSSLQARL